MSGKQGMLQFVDCVVNTATMVAANREFLLRNRLRYDYSKIFFALDVDRDDCVVCRLSHYEVCHCRL